MQLLERNDGKKWFLWIAQGRIGRDNISTQIFEHFNKVDAIGDFEKRFFKRTENKWTERDNFKEHTGKFILVIAERELEKLHNALAAEKEVTQALTLAFSDKMFEKSLHHAIKFFLFIKFLGTRILTKMYIHRV